MHRHAGLAVVDRDNRLKGYISRSSMLAVLVEEMGLELGGNRIAIEVEDRKGVMAELSRLFFDLGVNILSTSTFYRDNKRLIVFRILADDMPAIVKVVTDKGYKIAGPEYFAHEWA